MHKHGGDIYRNKVVLDYSSNINLLGLPENVIEAAMKGIKLSCHYPDTQCQRLREAISLKEEIPSEEIICGNGAADLIYSLVIGTQPKKALIIAPTFFEYENALAVAKCQITYYYLKEELKFSLKEDFLNHLSRDLDVIFLCAPNNPTGTLIPLELMKKIIAKCEEYEILLIVDECFMDFVKESKDYSVKNMYRNSKNLFVLKAFTKLYAMPGMRLGYGFSTNRELLEKMKRVSQPWSVSVPAQLAGIAALKEEEYVKESLSILEVEKRYLIQELEKLHMKIYGSKANYIFFKGSPGLYKKCLEKEILIRDCSNYVGLCEGYYRVVVKKHKENEELIRVLREVV